MGASNPHPHCQIWATASIPEQPARELEAQGKYLAAHGSCLLCDYVALEQRQATRIVCANEGFVAMVPFWAVWPFEVLLCSRRHLGAFPGIQQRRSRATERDSETGCQHLRSRIRCSIPLLDGISSVSVRWQRASGVAFSRAFFPAAAALGNGAEIHGGIRNAGQPAARHHARTGGGEAAIAGRKRFLSLGHGDYFQESNYWLTTAAMPAGTAGELPAEVDVAVIGAGYTGLSAARTLAKRGVKVVVSKQTASDGAPAPATGAWCLQA